MTPIPHASITTQWGQRYLSLLGVERAQPSMEALARLVQAHVFVIPFENVTAILRRGLQPKGPVPAPDPLALLDAWERRAGGGVCFEICAMLVQLLNMLGYHAHLVLGQISLPNGHQAILVQLGDARCLLDLGNGAPIFEPILLDGPPVEVHRHGLSYRFRAGDTLTEFIQDRMIDGAWSAHCHYDLQPARDADINKGYQHHHTPNASWVTGTLTLVRSTPEAVYALRDNTLTRHTVAGKTTETIGDSAHFRQIATQAFKLPHLPIEDALDFRARFSAPGSSY
jgi:arylamine N-acetyltransferase